MSQRESEYKATVGRDHVRLQRSAFQQYRRTITDGTTG